MSIVEEGEDIGLKYSATALILSNWFDEILNGKTPEIQKGILKSGKRVLENALGIFTPDANAENGRYFLFVIDGLQNATRKIYYDFEESKKDIRTCKELLEDLSNINTEKRKDYELARNMWRELHNISCENRVHRYRTGENKYVY